jgi:sRNA-binding regulator protein Hfq
MVFSRRRHFKRRHRPERFRKPPEIGNFVHPEDTGSEAAYLKSLIDSRAKITVVLQNGEQFHGRLRYYDRDCFSIGLSAKGPRIFLRKASVSYISEE